MFFNVTPSVLLSLQLFDVKPDLPLTEAQRHQVRTLSRMRLTRYGQSFYHRNSQNQANFTEHVVTVLPLWHFKGFFLLVLR